jgi:DNA repair exonuclease SbcCD ATPase subunit
MIVFKKIKWKNFLSTGNTPIEIALNTAPSTLIIGTNGAGKSTLLDAICFALFNRPFRLIKKEQIVNSINDADTEVILEFSIGTKEYKIIRGIKPTLFEIYLDGQLLNQDASSVDYQRYLENNILRLNYRSFVQVVILGSSSYEPFMRLRPRHRREVVEEILDIRVFGNMDVLLRNQQTALTDSIVDLKHKCDIVESKYELEQKHFNEIQNRNINDKDVKKVVLEENKKSLEKYIEEVNTYNKEIEQYNVSLKELDTYNKKANQLSKLEAKIETNLLKHKRTLEFFQNNDTCPECTQNINLSVKSDKITAETSKISKLDEGLKQLLSEIIETETVINNLNATSQKVNELLVKVAKANTSIEALKKYSDNIHSEILSLENKQTDGKNIQEQLNQLKIDLELSKKELIRITEEKQYIDVLRELLNDKGAKAMIIKKYIPIMNTLINQYLQSMDFFVSFHLDEEFNETVKSRHRDNFDYNNFSEGEKLRIDLALVFTWRAIAKIKNSAHTNLLILDEIFDSSLDGQGTDDFFKILRSLTKENIFIISHKGDILFDKFTNIIKFEKEHNFTRLQNV